MQAVVEAVFDREKDMPAYEALRRASAADDASLRPRAIGSK
jgi:hypothetical protein